jgi:hypothetical protein
MVKMHRSSAALTVASSLTSLFAFVLVLVQPAEGQSIMSRPPDGYTGYASFLSNGEADPTVPNPDGVPGCFQFTCSGDYFQTEIMGRTLAEVSSIEQDASRYFLDRFGVDVADPANMGKLFWRRFYEDPRAELRAYVISGKFVPRSGWRVHSGGWQVVFLEDFPLGGEHVGESAVAGSTLEWGEYLLEDPRRRHRRARDRSFVIAYRSGIVQNPTSNGIQPFQYELNPGRVERAHGGWGDTDFPHKGLDEGASYPSTPTSTPGVVRVNQRHTLTFSRSGGL